MSAASKTSLVAGAKATRSIGLEHVSALRWNRHRKGAVDVGRRRVFLPRRRGIVVAVMLTPGSGVVPDFTVPWMTLSGAVPPKEGAAGVVACEGVAVGAISGVGVAVDCASKTGSVQEASRMSRAAGRPFLIHSIDPELALIARTAKNLTILERNSMEPAALLHNRRGFALKVWRYGPGNWGIRFPARLDKAQDAGEKDIHIVTDAALHADEAGQTFTSAKVTLSLRLRKEVFSSTATTCAFWSPACSMVILKSRIAVTFPAVQVLPKPARATCGPDPRPRHKQENGAHSPWLSCRPRLQPRACRLRGRHWPRSAGDLS